jgi:hypothetical protein
MEKYILREGKQVANELIVKVENIVLPIVKNLIERLADIGVTSDIKQRVGEIFVGNYQIIETIHKEALEKDVSLFKTHSAKDVILKQHDDVIADFKESTKDQIDEIRSNEVEGLYLNDPKILDYIEFDKEGIPVISKENKAAILERYTTYVETELGAEFHKKHIDATNTLNELLLFCEKIGVKFYLPIQLFTTFFERGEDINIEPAKIDYDDIVLSRAKKEQDKDEDTEERSSVTITRPSKPHFKNLSSQNGKKVKTVTKGI